MQMVVFDWVSRSFQDIGMPDDDDACLFNATKNMIIENYSSIIYGEEKVFYYMHGNAYATVVLFILPDTWLLSRYSLYFVRSHKIPTIVVIPILPIIVDIYNTLDAIQRRVLRNHTDYSMERMAIYCTSICSMSATRILSGKTI